MTTLYLNPEVLRPPRTDDRPESQLVFELGTQGIDPTVLLEYLLLVFPQTTVVLHAYGVMTCGYQFTVRQLPPFIRTHVIGSTFAGNRYCRFHAPPSTRRRDWLRADIRRRGPCHLAVVDSDCQEVLPELEDCTVIVQSDGLITTEQAGLLFSLLQEMPSAEPFEALAEPRLGEPNVGQPGDFSGTCC
ncbi:hypothetical protein BJN34_22670 [Cupriavidus necator]|uniref:Uncharacterized protein n=1 Tax=Cupriavidus necator TaxID=106590 RepID=A0A1U9UWT0_CUPNE|nr:hypothetical protein [Cupriavidus necator]AQV96671.1 hypothetical protein BJN34_22670 [Cupriavidus necator]